MKILNGGVRHCLMTIRSKSKKRNTITFEPDEDVATGLAEVEKALGKTRGIRTEIINSALRLELPNVIRRKAAALQKLVSEDDGGDCGGKRANESAPQHRGRTPSSPSRAGKSRNLPDPASKPELR